MSTPTPPTPPPSSATPQAAGPARWTPEQLEVGIVTALHTSDFGAAGRLLSLLADRDRGRANMVHTAMVLGASFAAVPEPRLVRSVGVDFDGVLHAYRDGWRDGTIYDEAMPGALAGLWGLMQLGAVFVFTSRGPAPVAAWLGERGVSVALEYGPGGVGEPQFWEDRDRVLITNRKLPATLYLDDRAIRFQSWAEAMYAVAEHWTAARARSGV